MGPITRGTGCGSSAITNHRVKLRKAGCGRAACAARWGRAAAQKLGTVSRPKINVSGACSPCLIRTRQQVRRVHGKGRRNCRGRKNRRSKDPSQSGWVARKAQSKSSGRAGRRTNGRRAQFTIDIREPDMLTRSVSRRVRRRLFKRHKIACCRYIDAVGKKHNNPGR